MHSAQRRLSMGLVLGLLSAIVVPTSSLANDADLFTTTAVAPNVLLVIDNSASMNHIIWHEDFTPGTVYSCNQATYGAWVSSDTTHTGAFDPNEVYFYDGQRFGRNDPVLGFVYHTNYGTQTHCGRTRTLINDSNAAGNQGDLDNNKRKWTRYTGEYLNWIFSAEADAAWAQISNGSNGFPSSCVGGNAFGKYQRTRMNVAKQVLKDVVCQVNLVGQVRFGIAIFRSEGTGTDDPNGGYVLEEVDFPTSNQQADLVSAIQSVTADTHAPIAETLFQSYTYFMSRNVSDLPVSVLANPTPEVFPVYQYDTKTNSTGGNYSTNAVPADPMQYSCQKSFIILITDGDSERDDFDQENPTNTAAGFDRFQQLIGDYVPDGEIEAPAGVGEMTRYADDIAKYMTENDMRPDFAGEQTIDTYTVGFAVGSSATAMLQKTAAAGNGLFFGANDEDELAQAIIDALTAIIEKAQSFTAATVPASRTAAGDQLYISLFTPTSKTSYWNGRLRSYTINGAGQILDKFGNCALDDPSGQCLGGPFLDSISSPPHWDAADQLPAPMNRNLLVSRLDALGNPQMVDFRATLNTPAPFPSGPLTATDLGMVYPPPTTYSPLSLATTADELTAEVIANVRGCEFPGGTSLDGSCIRRQTVLNDIFHSNPVVAGTPGAFQPGTYKDFRLHYETNRRDRVIYAGSNGGFFHAFHAGDWDSVNKRYTPGTGIELFGFMPWYSRTRIKEKPLDSGSRDEYFVDGSPTLADVLFYNPVAPGVVSSDWRDWYTIAISGLRHGGPQYFALEVTDSDGTHPKPRCVGYPCYLWEFPAENDTNGYGAWMGDTWGEPIITKIKLDVGGTIVERWVTVVTGGYAESGDPNDHSAYTVADTSGRSVWILDAMTGEPIAVRRFDSANNDCGAAYDAANPERHMCYSIAATPGVYDVDGNGFSDLIVVVDLGGQVWKWIIEGPGFDPVNTSKVLADNDNSVWPFRKFFEAPVYNDGSNNFYKSFFFAPAATKSGNTIWIAMGSGERNELLHMGDTTITADNNRYYVLKDVDWNDSSFTPLSPPTVKTESGLLDVTTTNTCADISAYDGYFFLGAEGEKWVTAADVFQYNVIVSSYVPVPSTDPCDIGGQAFLYVFRIDCSQPYFTDPNTGVPTRSIDLGVGLPTDPRISVGPDGSSKVIISKQGGEILTITGPPAGGGNGMFYWRELKD